MHLFILLRLPSDTAVQTHGGAPTHPLVQGSLLDEIKQCVIDQGQVFLGSGDYGDDDIVADGLLGVM